MQIPPKMAKELRNKKIKALYKVGFTMDQIVKELGVSKTTVHFVLKGRLKTK